MGAGRGCGKVGRTGVAWTRLRPQGRGGATRARRGDTALGAYPRLAEREGAAGPGASARRAHGGGPGGGRAERLAGAAGPPAPPRGRLAWCVCVLGLAALALRGPSGQQVGPGKWGRWDYLPRGLSHRLPFVGEEKTLTTIRATAPSLARGPRACPRLDGSCGRVQGQRRICCFFFLTTYRAHPGGGQSVHVLNGKQEGVALSVCPGPPGLGLLYRYGVCVVSLGSSW